MEVVKEGGIIVFYSRNQWSKVLGNLNISANNCGSYQANVKFP